MKCASGFVLDATSGAARIPFVDPRAFGRRTAARDEDAPSFFWMHSRLVLGLRAGRLIHSALDWATSPFGWADDGTPTGHRRCVSRASAFSGEIAPRRPPSLED
eukprot:4381870-Pyramimonas_sp.AAC.1